MFLALNGPHMTMAGAETTLHVKMIIMPVPFCLIFLAIATIDHSRNGYLLAALTAHSLGN